MTSLPPGPVFAIGTAAVFAARSARALGWPTASLFLLTGGGALVFCGYVLLFLPALYGDHCDRP